MTRPSASWSRLHAQEPSNFLVQSNLATAYQLVGQESRAIATLEQALAVWPREMDKVAEPFQSFLQSNQWHDARFNFYRTAETYQLKLLKLRAREDRARPGSKADFDAVDALFDDGKTPPRPVRFVGPTGQFEPGGWRRRKKRSCPRTPSTSCSSF